MTRAQQSQFNKEFTSARRSAGQYRRYYGTKYEAIFGESWSDFGLSQAKTSKQVQKAMLNIELASIRTRIKEREMEDEADILIENCKVVLTNAAISRTGNKYTTADMEASRAIINSIIENSVSKYGKVLASIWLSSYSAEEWKELVRLVRALYDEYYNTNNGIHYTSTTKEGELGRQRYRTAIEEFAKVMGVTVPEWAF